MEGRIDTLDSVRGLASFSVLLHHLYLTTLTPMLPLLFTGFSPLKAAVSGTSAVMLFFVLSGFVLMLPFAQGRQVPYSSFLVKRFLRIYVPYLLSTAAAILLSSLLADGGGIPGLSDKLNENWRQGLTPRLALEHLFLVGNLHSGAFNNVIWSLVQELRVSFLFPLIAWLVCRYNAKVVAVIALLCSAVTGLNEALRLEPSYGDHTALLSTFHYVSLFMLGAFVAKHRSRISAAMLRMTFFRKIAIFLLGFCLYTYSSVIHTVCQRLGIPVGEIVMNLATGTGACLLLLTALHSGRVRKVLLVKPILFVGKISYSLYLYHYIVLLSLLYAFYGRLPLYAIFLSTVVLSLIVAALSYRYVELPAMRWGRALADRRRNELGRRAGIKIGIPK